MRHLKSGIANFSAIKRRVLLNQSIPNELLPARKLDDGSAVPKK